MRKCSGQSARHARYQQLRVVRLASRPSPHAWHAIKLATCLCCRTTVPAGKGRSRERAERFDAWGDMHPRLKTWGDMHPRLKTLKACYSVTVRRGHARRTSRESVNKTFFDGLLFCLPSLLLS